MAVEAVGGEGDTCREKSKGDILKVSHLSILKERLSLELVLAYRAAFYYSRF
jgi:hypothetical protein